MKKSTKKGAAAKTRKPAPKLVVDSKGHATVQDGDAPAVATPETPPTAKAVKGKAAKTPKEKPAREPKEDLVVFAFRLTTAERDAIHAAAGPAKASKFVRMLAVAAANGDEAGMKELLKAVGAAK